MFIRVIYSEYIQDTKIYLRDTWKWEARQKIKNKNKNRKIFKIK